MTLLSYRIVSYQSVERANHRGSAPRYNAVLRPRCDDTRIQSLIRVDSHLPSPTKVIREVTSCSSDDAQSFSQVLVGLCYGGGSAASGGSYPPGCALWTVPFRYPDSSRTHWRYGRQFVSVDSEGQEPHSARSAPWPATQFGIRT